MAVTAYKLPGTAATVDRDGENIWISPNNAKVCDDVHSICQVEKGTYGDWLRCTNYGFTTGDIPSGAIIDGIEVKIQRQSANQTNITDSAIYLRNTSGQVGDNKASATGWKTNVDEEVFYGGAADKWSAGLVDTDIVSSNFGIDISAANSDTISPNTHARINCVSIRVYYTVSGGARRIFIIGS